MTEQTCPWCEHTAHTDEACSGESRSGMRPTCGCVWDQTEEFQSRARVLHVTTTDTTPRVNGGFTIMSGCHTCGWVWVRDTHPATPEWMGLRMGHAMADQHELKSNGELIQT